MHDTKISSNLVLGELIDEIQRVDASLQLLARTFDVVEEALGQRKSLWRHFFRDACWPIAKCLPKKKKQVSSRQPGLASIRSRRRRGVAVRLPGSKKKRPPAYHRVSAGSVSFADDDDDEDEEGL